MFQSPLQKSWAFVPGTVQGHPGETGPVSVGTGPVHRAQPGAGKDGADAGPLLVE